LKTNDVWLSLGQPGQKVFAPFVDVVDVESGDFHVWVLRLMRANGDCERSGSYPDAAAAVPWRSGAWYFPVVAAAVLF
jgi:hypothetical protein